MQTVKEEVDRSASTKGGEVRGSYSYSQNSDMMDLRVIEYYERASGIDDIKFR